jgi:hypothetical protein
MIDGSLNENDGGDVNMNMIGESLEEVDREGVNMDMNGWQFKTKSYNDECKGGSDQGQDEGEVEDLDHDQDLNLKYDIVRNTNLSNRELSKDENLVFLRENELTETEMTWLRKFEVKSEIRMLRLIGQIMLDSSAQPESQHCLLFGLLVLSNVIN